MGERMNRIVTLLAGAGVGAGLLHLLDPALLGLALLTRSSANRPFRRMLDHRGRNTI